MISNLLGSYFNIERRQIQEVDFEDCHNARPRPEWLFGSNLKTFEPADHDVLTDFRNRFR